MLFVLLINKVKYNLLWLVWNHPWQYSLLLYQDFNISRVVKVRYGTAILQRTFDISSSEITSEYYNRDFREVCIPTA